MQAGDRGSPRSLPPCREMAGQKNKDEKATLAGIAAEADAQIKKNAAIDKVQTAVNQKYLAGLSVGETPMTAANG